jgi:hypothetical protein
MSWGYSAAICLILRRVIALWPADDIGREQVPRWRRAVAREVDFCVIPGNHASVEAS